MIPKCKTLFFIFSIIRYNSDRDFSSVLFNISESLLNILILDSFVVVVDSGISYKSNNLAFLTAIVILKSLSYLMLCSRYCFIFFLLILDPFRYKLYFWFRTHFDPV